MTTPPLDPAPSGASISNLFLPEVSSLDDLERHLKVPRETIVEELASGRLAGLYLRGRWLVHRDALKTWLNAYGGGR